MDRNELMSQLIGNVFESMVQFSKVNEGVSVEDCVIALTEAAAFSSTYANFSKEYFVDLAARAFDLMTYQQEGASNVQ
jgi:hypothetical protein